MDIKPTKTWHYHDQPGDHWFGDYWLEWFEESCTLIFRAKGQDTPIDPWGFHHAYPAETMQSWVEDCIVKYWGESVLDEVKGLLAGVTVSGD